MIDAERLLGSLVRNALAGDRGGGRKRRRKRRGRGVSSTLGIPNSALAMGALGTAIAAFEHFSGKDTDRIGRGTSAPTPRSPGGASGAPLPPLPGSLDPSSVPADSADLPPLPTAGAPRQPADGSNDAEALLLIQAMIAAAHADHELDETERDRILAALEESELSAEDRAFLVAELEHPKSLTALAARATSPDLARQVYLASAMAIDVDSPTEESYLSKLAERLGLSTAEVDELVGMLDD